VGSDVVRVRDGGSPSSMVSYDHSLHAAVIVGRDLVVVMFSERTRIENQWAVGGAEDTATSFPSRSFARREVKLRV
jgi:hypothetical protein